MQSDDERAPDEQPSDTTVADFAHAVAFVRSTSSEDDVYERATRDGDADAACVVLAVSRLVARTHAGGHAAVAAAHAAKNEGLALVLASVLSSETFACARVDDDDESFGVVCRATGRVVAARDAVRLTTDAGSFVLARSTMIVVQNFASYVHVLRFIAAKPDASHDDLVEMFRACERDVELMAR